MWAGATCRCTCRSTFVYVLHPTRNSVLVVMTISHHTVPQPKIILNCSLSNCQQKKCLFKLTKLHSAAAVFQAPSAENSFIPCPTYDSLLCMIYCVHMCVIFHLCTSKWTKEDKDICFVLPFVLLLGYS